MRLHGDAVWAAGARPAPPMRLRDQRGQVVSLADLRDRVLLVTFMDSHCTKECPVEGHQLAVVQRAFPPRSRPEIVVVSVNPADTPRSARRFARLARLAWAMALAHGILGPAAQRVWRAYGIEVDPTSHDIIHSAALYIVDRRGDERSGYVAPFLPKLVTADVRSAGAARCVSARLPGPGFA